MLQKDGYANLKSIGTKILKHDDLNLLNTIVMYFEKDDNSGDDFVFDYFNHIVIPSPSEISAFVRNATNKTYILNWDRIIQYTPPLNNLITFNTPQFFEANTYNEYINLSKKTQTGLIYIEWIQKKIVIVILKILKMIY